MHAGEQALPTSLDDVGAPWLTSALQRAWPGIRVARAVITRVVHGTATGCRVSLRYCRHLIYPLVGWLCTGYPPERVCTENVARFAAAASDHDVLALA